jgi:chemotaxis family two-component system response regulator Rcp1
MLMTGARATAPVEILLVEDSPDDADLMIEALNAGSLNSRITVVEDGEEAIAYLRGGNGRALSAAPHLILLDLHLPRMNGHEVLAEIKQDAALRRIPVVIMTSSEKDQDFIKAYDLYANCCVSKPMNQEQFAQTVQKIELFWLRVARTR